VSSRSGTWLASPITQTDVNPSRGYPRESREAGRALVITDDDADDVTLLLLNLGSF